MRHRPPGLARPGWLASSALAAGLLAYFLTCVATPRGGVVHGRVLVVGAPRALVHNAALSRRPGRTASVRVQQSPSFHSDLEADRTSLHGRPHRGGWIEPTGGWRCGTTLRTLSRCYISECVRLAFAVFHPRQVGGAARGSSGVECCRARAAFESVKTERPDGQASGGVERAVRLRLRRFCCAGPFFWPFCLIFASLCGELGPGRGARPLHRLPRQGDSPARPSAALGSARTVLRSAMLGSEIGSAVDSRSRVSFKRPPLPRRGVTAPRPAPPCPRPHAVLPYTIKPILPR